VVNADSVRVTRPSPREIEVARRLEALRALVWDVVTEPAHVCLWWASRELAEAECEIDLAPGRGFRLSRRAGGGGERVLAGVYHEVAPPSRLVFTLAPGAAATAEALVMVGLTEQHGATTLTCRVVFATAADRDAALSGGIEARMVASYERLAAYVEGLARD
jgi:uncharacterized protein YndB with AHSA1/START domain